MKKQSNPANPQGKGLVPILESLANSRTMIPVVPKHINQISSELFTSLFILHSNFQFKPVIGKSYWLYQRNHQFLLSLVSPQEWGKAEFGLFVGECVLQKDVTWTLKLDPAAENDHALMLQIENKRHELDKVFSSAQSINSVLPVYLDGLPFYQRVFASALANSLKCSMMKSGIDGLTYSQAQKSLSSG